MSRLFLFLDMQNLMDQGTGQYILQSLSEETKGDIYIEESDFKIALKKVQPSA